jgi:hypothetical protein
VITTVTPSIPVRGDHGGMLERALASIRAQTLPPSEVVVEFDEFRQGAAATRQRGLEKVATDWVAFLDDDDEMKPWHLETLARAAEESGADYVYSWYEVSGGLDPMWQFFGQPWDDAAPHQTTITTLVRTDLAQSVGFGGEPEPDPNGGGAYVSGEDYRFTLGCLAAGARILHVPQVTWIWHHHGANTSGLPDRW